MWIRHVVCVAVVVALGCGSEEDNSQAGTGGASGAAGMAVTTGGAGGTGGTTVATGGTGGMMTGTGGMASLCPANPGITMCGGTACPAVADNLATICVQTCCTAAMECGTLNGAMMSECLAPVGNDTMCPNETIMGNAVPGCCLPNSNQCGIVNIIGDMSCVARTSPILALLGAAFEAMNCDGTPVEMMGTGGMMMGTGGMMMGTGGMEADAGL